MPNRSKYSRFFRLSRALLVAVQCETESTLSWTFLEDCALRMSIWPGGTSPAINSSSVSFEMEGFAVHVAVHLRVRQKDFCRAALRDDLQHARLLQLLEGLRGEDHGGVQFSPRLLCLNDVVADGLVADEEPCFIQQEHLERGKILRVGDLIAGPVEDVKQQRLQHVGSITPSGEVEGLETAEGKRVLGVVEEKAVLPAARPAMQALFQFADDVGEVGDGALVRLQHIHALDAIPQLALLFEVQPVTLAVAFDQHTEEAEREIAGSLWWVAARMG